MVPRASAAPWGLPADTLAGTAYAGLQPLFFSVQEHIHVHLDIFVNGVRVPVPPGMGQPEPQKVVPGYHESSEALGSIHTHADSGILHVESDTSTGYTLGHFFDEWEVRLTDNCHGSYCTGEGSSLRTFVNGQLFNSSPRDAVLSRAAEIALVYGPPNVPSSIPSSYTPPRPPWTAHSTTSTASLSPDATLKRALRWYRPRVRRPFAATGGRGP